MAEHMLKVMYAADGVGLANPGGLMKRMVVIDVDYPNGQEKPFVLINPEIKIADGEPVCTRRAAFVPRHYQLRAQVMLSFTHITSI